MNLYRESSTPRDTRIVSRRAAFAGNGDPIPYSLIEAWEYS